MIPPNDDQQSDFCEETRAGNSSTPIAEIYNAVVSGATSTTTGNLSTTLMREKQQRQQQDLAFMTPPHDFGHPRLLLTTNAEQYDDKMALLDQCLEVIDEALCIIDGDDGSSETLIDTLAESNRNRLPLLPYRPSGSINFVSTVSCRPQQ